MNQRNPGRIDIILNNLREEWIKAPDLRLTQLITNLMPVGRGSTIAPVVYNLEDDYWIDNFGPYKENK